MTSLNPLYRGRWAVGRRLYSKRAIREVMPIPDSPIIPTWRVVSDIKYGNTERESAALLCKETVGRKQIMLREWTREEISAISCIISVRMFSVSRDTGYGCHLSFDLPAGRWGGGIR
jgi:hypothetical protein